MFTSKISRSIVSIAAVLTFVAAFSLSSEAQTKRKTGTSKPVATPTPLPSDDAQIISRAADLQEPTVLVAQPVNKQTDDPVDPNAQKVKDLTARVKKLEAAKVDPYDERQKRLLLNLDILTRAEQRSESLRKQLFDMIEKESAIKSRLEQNEYDSRPEIINRSATFSGSMKPEEIRDMRKKSLDAERANLQDLLSQIQATKSTLAANLAKSETLVDKLRSKLEKDIDDSFKDDDKDQ